MIYPEVHAAIKSMFFAVYHKAKFFGLPTTNIKLFIHPMLADVLELSDKLTIDNTGFTYTLPIIKKEDVELNTIYIYDDTWAQPTDNIINRLFRYIKERIK